MLRHPADRKTMLWAAAMPLPAVAQYLWPSTIPFLLPVACYLALAAGVIAHNHNHCPTFHSKALNRGFGHWLSLFYGYPVFAWVPTHNLNHHKFVNRAGDATITWRYTNRHSLWVALTYFFVSSYWQSDPINAYIRKARAGNRRLYGQILFGYALWAGAAVALLASAIGLHGWKLGLGVWLAATVAPAFFALFTIMLFNYEQHVHTDPWSEHNHSRSWTGGLVNFLLFNNGFHAAHHENAGLHWSQLPKAHAALAPAIDPRLIEGGMCWYFLKCYALAPFFPRLGTTQVGRAPFDVPGGAALDLTSADVVAAEAGDNATFVGLERTELREPAATT